MAYKRTLVGAWLAAACLIALLDASHIHAAEKIPQNLPKGWDALSMPSLRGSFMHPGSDDVAVMMHSRQAGMDDLYGLVVVPNAASGLPPRVVKNFTDNGTNPPRLSLVKPGTYTPVCHDGGRCAPVKIANEAISLCFGEASCEIVYFNGSAFRELFVTD